MKELQLKLTTTALLGPKQTMIVSCCFRNFNFKRILKFAKCAVAKIRLNLTWFKFLFQKFLEEFYNVCECRE